MAAPNHILYKGIMYRLAADAPMTDTIQETASNPVADLAAAPAPEAENPPTLAPSPDNEDIKTLEMLVGNVNSRATALSTGLAPLLEKVKAKSRADADTILASAKNSLDSLVEDFKLLASKYAGYARRSMSETKEQD